MAWDIALISFLNEKISEVEDFAKNKGVIKMELASLENYSQEETDNTNMSINRNSGNDNDSNDFQKKKIYINSDSSESDKNKFDDNFEVK